MICAGKQTNLHYLCHPEKMVNCRQIIHYLIKSICFTFITQVDGCSGAKHDGTKLKLNCQKMNISGFMKNNSKILNELLLWAAAIVPWLCLE